MAVHPARAVLGGQLGCWDCGLMGFRREGFASRVCLIVSMSEMKSRRSREGFGVKGAGCSGAATCFRVIAWGEARAAWMMGKRALGVISFPGSFSLVPRPPAPFT